MPTDARLRHGTDAAWTLSTEQTDAPVWTEPAPPVRGLVRDLSGKRREQSGISLKETSQSGLHLYIKLWCAFHQSVQSRVVKFTNFIKFCQICFSKYCVTVFFIKLLLGFKEINKLWTQILLTWNFDIFMAAFTEICSHRRMFYSFQAIAGQNAAAMWWLDEFFFGMRFQSVTMVGCAVESGWKLLGLWPAWIFFQVWKKRLRQFWTENIGLNLSAKQLYA